jgi:hypothetical protein
VPVTLDAHPKHSVALGAAQVGARILGYVEPVPVVAAPPTTLPEWTAPTAPTAPTAAPPQVPPTAPPPIAPAPVPPTPPTRSKKPAIIAVVAVLAVAAIAAALLVSRGGGSSGGESAKPLPFGFVDNTNTDCDPDTPAGFGNGIVLTDTGDLLISSASHHEVKRVAQDGEVTTFAGTGTQGSSGDGGPATDAQLNGPTMLAIDSSGAVFIADDEANVIRKVDRNGTISTVLGVTEPIDGVGGMVFDAGGALLVSQRSEGIFRADPNNGFQLDPFVAAESPGAVAFDLHGSLVFQDGDKIRRRGDDGTTTTIAGTGTVGHSGDGGPATGAQTCVPDGIAVDPNGNVYFADSRNERVRGIGTDGIMLTVAGSSAADARSDTGNPQALDLFTAEGVAVNDDSDVFFIDGFDLFEVDHTGRARHIAEYDVS